jgi:hypothetical protein
MIDRIIKMNELTVAKHKRQSNVARMIEYYSNDE